MRVAPAAVLIALAALAGCYDTPRPACAFLCGSDNACPSGYTCASDGWCKRDDVGGDYTCGPALPDAAPADAPIDATEIDAPIDAEVDAAIDAEVDASPDADPDAGPAMLSILSDNPIDFGNVPVTQATVLTISVQNSGGLPTSALTIAVTGGGFSLVTDASDTCSGHIVAPSATCSFQIRFVPLAGGPNTGMVSASATSGGTASANLAGFGTPILMAVPLMFPPTTVGSTADATMVVSNAGSVTTGAITVTPPTGVFSVLTDTCQGAMLAPAATCSVMIRFAPTSLGLHSSPIRFDAPPDIPYQLSVYGNGI